MNNKVLVIAGPTATGKTALSVGLSKELNGEVISADSIQIYKKLNIGSAKPNEREKQGIVHHLMDFLEPDATYSVADYVKDAKEKIDEIFARNKVPIIAGGTGLYISSLVDNVEFSDVDADTSVRERLYKELEELGIEAMHERLEKIDPESACAIHPNNTKRVIRALEIYETTGKTKKELEKGSKLRTSPYDFCLIGLNCDRELLYERINKRVDMMIEQGLFSEVEELLSGGVSKDAQSMQGIGYKEVVMAQNGEITEDECIELIKKNSRNYAKRQLTWFRRSDYKWFDCLDKDLYKKVRKHIGEFGI
ncbi:MAG: tRNA (adenosine(37)-N6)-dimethylallyltransferase MiaA [Clostridia bacterium]|nr:tRNA (adenosine(37)-N6)-dimethylallyltransferase MiaA [Clostridia bacterium]